MNNTVAQTLGAAGSVAPSLVAEGAWHGIRALAALLPAPLVRAFYLECRLHADMAPVDWIVRVEEPGRDILAGRNPRLRLPESLRMDPVWTQVARLCAAWADEPLLRRVVSHLWLEFDLGLGPPPPGGSVPRPSVFAAIDQRAVKGLGASGWSLLLDQLVQHLGADDAGSPARHRALRAVLARLPADAEIPYVGFMLARPVPAVRIYLLGGTPASIAERMHGLGWPGARSEVTALLERFGGLPVGVAPEISMAHLDVDRDVLPRAGIEFRFARRPQLSGTLAETPFLERLVELGLCTGEKRDGMLAWPGHSVGVLPHELWRSVIARRVNCVKLLHEPGRPPEAKGYLLADWRPVPCGSRYGGGRGAWRNASPASTQ